MVTGTVFILVIFCEFLLTFQVSTARVTQINPRWARCAILCVKDIVLAEPFRGQLRKEDVRATEKDRVEMYKCFRPNDIILARVVIILFLSLLKL